MNSTRIHEVFNTFGKLLNLDQIGAAYASGIKAAVVGIENQNAAAANSVDPYDELQQFIGPALNSVRSVVQGLDRVPLIAKAGLDSYITIIGTSELNQPDNTPPATILSTLIGAMNAVNDTVAPSGAVYSYFLSTYGVELPQNSSPTIADAIITTTIL